MSGTDKLWENVNESDEDSKLNSPDEFSKDDDIEIDSQGYVLKKQKTDPYVSAEIIKEKPKLPKSLPPIPPKKPILNKKLLENGIETTEHFTFDTEPNSSSNNNIDDDDDVDDEYDETGSSSDDDDEKTIRMEENEELR